MQSRRLKIGRLLSPLAALFLLANVVPTAATAATPYKITVVLKSGERYEDVRYRVRPEASILEIKVPGEQGEPARVINVSFPDIQAIYDEKERDVARALLGSGYRPATEEANSPPGGEEPPEVEVAPPAHQGAPERPAVAEPASPARRTSLRARAWSVALGAGGGFHIPFGDYYEGIGEGVGFGGTIHVRLTRDLALRGSVTRLGLDFDKKFGLVSYDPQLQIITQSYELNATRFLGGVEYFKNFGPSGPRWGFWYVHGTIGAIRHELSGDATFLDTVTSQVVRLTANDTETRFTMGNGIGVIYGVTERLGLDLSADLDWIWTDVYTNSGTTAGVKGWVLGLNAGLAARF